MPTVRALPRSPPAARSFPDDAAATAEVPATAPPATAMPVADETAPHIFARAAARGPSDFAASMRARAVGESDDSFIGGPPSRGTSSDGARLRVVPRAPHA